MCTYIRTLMYITALNSNISDLIKSKTIQVTPNNTNGSCNIGKKIKALNAQFIKKSNIHLIDLMNSTHF